MAAATPFIAIALEDRMFDEVGQMYAISRNGITDKDKERGIELLLEAYAEVLDTCFTQMLHHLNQEYSSEPLRDLEKLIERVKHEARHHIAWVSKFIANHRVPPVIDHFHSILKQEKLKGKKQTFIQIPVSTDYETKARAILAQLHESDLSQIDEGVELFIEAIEMGVDALVHKPKDLMKFNFLVNKGLDGVIVVILKLMRHQLRKLPPHIAEPAYPMIAAHLESFLVGSKA